VICCASLSTSTALSGGINRRVVRMTMQGGWTACHRTTRPASTSLKTGKWWTLLYSMRTTTLGSKHCRYASAVGPRSGAADTDDDDASGSAGKAGKVRTEAACA